MQQPDHHNADCVAMRSPQHTGSSALCCQRLVRPEFALLLSILPAASFAEKGAALSCLLCPLPCDGATVSLLACEKKKKCTEYGRSIHSVCFSPPYWMAPLRYVLKHRRRLRPSPQENDARQSRPGDFSGRTETLRLLMSLLQPGRLLLPGVSKTPSSQGKASDPSDDRGWPRAPRPLVSSRTWRRLW